MTTTPPPEASEPGEPGTGRPAEPEAPQRPLSSEQPAGAVPEGPAQPPSSPPQNSADDEQPARDQQSPYSAEPSPSEPPPQYAEPGQQYPAPPPLPPEAFPTYGGGRGYEYGEYGAPPVRRRNGMGVAALVLGVVGFLVGPCSILAIIFGRIGLNRVARGEATNRGVAQAGFVLGIVTLVLWILGLILLANR
ncbi:DUF4190 domain-containing protein [Catenulispora sp. NL8]|uniref:DUF4190 domain-containing protein n=1 Tax=Catenulispora pinistramenti TaxID=2705254 RepID=A0ABS5KT13_9ACTN|nr:DUF4190 domain-containing protein [Catenulispora pinistramenti]MBS2549182.1 DUF4190 domain-containing protein [Catenulispora pinistramenti]